MAVTARMISFLRRCLASTFLIAACGGSDGTSDAAPDGSAGAGALSGGGTGGAAGRAVGGGDAGVGGRGASGGDPVSVGKEAVATNLPAALSDADLFVIASGGELLRWSLKSRESASVLMQVEAVYARGSNVWARASKNRLLRSEGEGAPFEDITPAVLSSGKMVTAQPRAADLLVGLVTAEGASIQRVQLDGTTSPLVDDVCADLAVLAASEESLFWVCEDRKVHCTALRSTNGADLDAARDHRGEDRTPGGRRRPRGRALNHSGVRAVERGRACGAFFIGVSAAAWMFPASAGQEGGAETKPAVGGAAGSAVTQGGSAGAGPMGGSSAASADQKTCTGYRLGAANVACSPWSRRTLARRWR